MKLYDYLGNLAANKFGKKTTLVSRVGKCLTPIKLQIDSIMSDASFGLKLACFYLDKKQAVPGSFLPMTSKLEARGA